MNDKPDDTLSAPFSVPRDALIDMLIRELDLAGTAITVGAMSPIAAEAGRHAVMFAKLAKMVERG